eukprot:IDg8289t1
METAAHSRDTAGVTNSAPSVAVVTSHVQFTSGTINRHATHWSYENSPSTGWMCAPCAHKKRKDRNADTLKQKFDPLANTNKSAGDISNIKNVCRAKHIAQAILEMRKPSHPESDSTVELMIEVEDSDEAATPWRWLLSFGARSAKVDSRGVREPRHALVSLSWYSAAGSGAFKGRPVPDTHVPQCCRSSVYNGKDSDRQILLSEREFLSP